MAPPPRNSPRVTSRPAPAGSQRPGSRRPGSDVPAALPAPSGSRAPQPLNPCPSDQIPFHPARGARGPGRRTRPLGPPRGQQRRTAVRRDRQAPGVGGVGGEARLSREGAGLGPLLGQAISLLFLLDSDSSSRARGWGRHLSLRRAEEPGRAPAATLTTERPPLRAGPSPRGTQAARTSPCAPALPARPSVPERWPVRSPGHPRSLRTPGRLGSRGGLGIITTLHDGTSLVLYLQSPLCLCVCL